MGEAGRPGGLTSQILFIWGGEDSHQHLDCACPSPTRPKLGVGEGKGGGACARKPKALSVGEGGREIEATAAKDPS